MGTKKKKQQRFVYVLVRYSEDCSKDMCEIFGVAMTEEAANERREQVMDTYHVPIKVEKFLVLEDFSE